MAAELVVLRAGLCRFDGLFSLEEQAALVQFSEDALQRGRSGQLKGKSYQMPPADWMARGQGRETVHFGVLVKCNKVLLAEVEPLPEPLLAVLTRLEAAGVLTPEQRCDAENITLRLLPVPSEVLTSMCASPPTQPGFLSCR